MFEKGRGCGDDPHIPYLFTRDGGWKMLIKDKKTYAAIIDLDKAYDNWLYDNVGCHEGIWCGWKFAEWGKLFYKDANACIRVNGETSESFGIPACD